jgi:hypothetical protein
MSRTPREIEQAFNRVRFESFIEDLRRSWGMWAFIIAALVGVAYYSITPLSPGELHFGTAVGIHQRAREDSGPVLRMAVELDSGTIANVWVPRGLLYRAGSRVEVEVTRRDWPPRIDRYRFIRYVDAGASSPPTANP